MESIGQVLKTERERRGLSLDQVHDSTRITIQNLGALEQDRFDQFPNRVYARAFLRDYANFLGLDSAELLARYEEEWGASRETQPQPRTALSVWRAIGYALLTIVVIGVLGAAGYFGWMAYEKRSGPRIGSQSPAAEREEVATLPRVESVPPPPPQPEVEREPEPARAPEAEPEAEPERPAEPEKLVLEVTAVRNVWVRVKTDGKIAFDGYLPPQAVKTFEAGESLNIRTGMADAVRLKLNGEPQPPLGTVRQIGERTFTRQRQQAGAKPAGSQPAHSP